jgi:Protein of unknown function (DUF3575)
MLKSFRFLCTTIVLLCFGIIKLSAQGGSELTTSHPLTLRLNPLALLDVDGNIMIGLGYQFHKRWAVTLEPGYVFLSPYFASNNRYSLSGVKIRSDIRFLFDKSKPGRFSSFIGPEFHYKNVSAKKSEDFGINCASGVCAYYQRAEYKEVKKEIGGSLKAGTLISFKERWNFELYIGLGVKFAKFNDVDIPVGGSFVNPPDQTNPFMSRNQDGAQILVPGGVKLVFRL